MQWEKTGENDIFEAGNAQIIIRSTQVTKILISKSIRKEILEKQLSDEPEKLKSLPMQGTFIDIENAIIYFLRTSSEISKLQTV